MSDQAPDDAPVEQVHDRPALDAQLELMDRQIIDNKGRMVAKVDDVEVDAGADGRLEVSGLLTGPGALGPRVGGVLGAVSTAAWSRLAGRAAHAPKRIDYRLVGKVDTALTLIVPREYVAVDGFETWARDRVIAALPGAGHDPHDVQDGGGDVHQPSAANHIGADAPNRRLSHLIGMSVTTTLGGLREHIVDVTLSAEGPRREKLIVDGFLIGRRRPGTLFGYHRHPRQGPWLVRAVVRSLHRHLRYVEWDSVVEIDWDDREVHVRDDGVQPLRNG